MHDTLENNQCAPEQAGLYVHVPFCAAKCRYCGFYSEPLSSHNTAALIDCLLIELSAYDIRSKVQTAYIGGGSPSSLPETLLLKLVQAIASQTSAITEFTIELNPGQADEQTLRKLRDLGVNRLSIGAQTFDEDQLRFLGRIHKTPCIEKAVQAARRAAFNNINLDLIFAIPGSSLQSWQATLQKAIALAPQHISAYSLTYEENTPLKAARDRGEFQPVDEELDRQMYDLTIDVLARAGYRQYEISNFAKPRFECRHNLLYWANLPYLGIGPAAASYWQGRRRTNIPNIKEYINRITQGQSAIAETESPSRIEIACETAVLNLRRIKGIDLLDFQNRTAFNAMELFAEPIARYKALGLLEVTAESIRLTRPALPIADSILADFAAP